MTLLDKEENNFYINKKIEFKPIQFTKSETIKKVFNFAYNMSFANEGEHRAYRSGGQYSRKNGQIFINAFQGKLAELSIYNEIFKIDKKIYNKLSRPDFSVYGLGKWDDSDIKFGELKFSIKSTKFYGNLLLLETKDWNDNGEYIPNENAIYDYFILVRINPDSENIMRNNRLLYSNKIDCSILYNVIINEKWSYDIVGYITYQDLKRVIQNKQILPQNAMLNGKIKMDAENYYIQSGDFKSFSDLILSFKSIV